MKIMFVLKEFPRLSETFILNQITELLDRGHRVDIFAQKCGSESTVHEDVERYRLRERTYYLNVPRNKVERIVKGAKIFLRNISRHPRILMRCLNPIRYGKRALSLYKLFEVSPFLNDYDIIHCQYGPIGVQGAALKELGVRGKLVTTFHGYDIRLGIEKGGEIYRSLIDQGDCIISISDYNYRNLTQFGFKPNQVKYLPVGIDVSVFRSKWERPPHETEGVFKILTVGRLVQEKGIEYGIRAVHKIRMERPDSKVEYRIIGAGLLEKELMSLTRELDLEETIHFLGPKGQREVLYELNNNDVFLLPSVAEALPVCLMEAQSVGLPVIATDVGDVRHLVLDCKSGFIVSPKDEVAIAEKLLYLSENRSLWRKMGGVGREHIKGRYDIKKLVEGLANIYESLLMENGGQN